MVTKTWRMEIRHDYADVWIAADRSDVAVDYAYGGTRMVLPSTSDTEATNILEDLMVYESVLKNRLINISFKKGVLDPYADRLPRGLQESLVGGARCIIRPKNREIYNALQDPTSPAFSSVISPILAEIGVALNEVNGKVKLTPDFGRFSGLADILAQYTPHVLGIRCEEGGCGGKSSYSSTGVIAALEYAGIADHCGPITLIGSAGAMGSGVLAYFDTRREQFHDVVICDLTYNKHFSAPETYLQLPSQEKCFTDACLRRGGIIVATTVGEELENSNWQFLPPGTTLLLAHNLAIPQGEEGITLMKQIAERGVFALPGQVLTLGGALTSRLEWFWRQSNPNQPFDKALAHLIVKEVVQFLIRDIQKLATETGTSPYEAMLLYTQSVNLVGL